MHIADRILLVIRIFFQLNNPRMVAERMLAETTLRHLETQDLVMYYTHQREYYAQRIAYLQDYLGHDAVAQDPGYPPISDETMEKYHVATRPRVE